MKLPDKRKFIASSLCYSATQRPSSSHPNFFIHLSNNKPRRIRDTDSERRDIRNNKLENTSSYVCGRSFARKLGARVIFHSSGEKTLVSATFRQFTVGKTFATVLELGELAKSRFLAVDSRFARRKEGEPRSGNEDETPRRGCVWQPDTSSRSSFDVPSRRTSEQRGRKVESGV